MSTAIATSPPNRTVIIPYDPHPGQRIIHNSTARYRIVANPTRWGKTLFVSHDLVRDGIRTLRHKLANYSKYRNHNPLVNMWVVAPHIPELRQVWREILVAIPAELQPRVNKSERIIFLAPDDDGKPQWLISGKSADKPETLVAEGLDHLFVDEGRGIKKDAWETLHSRLSDRHGRTTVIGTPGPQYDPGNPKELHWYYEMYLRGQSEEWKDHASWNIRGNMVTVNNPYGNPYYDPAEIETARKELSDRIFRRDYLAEFLPFAEGEAVVPEYDPQHHYQPVGDRYSPSRALYHVWDFGYGHPALTVHQFDAENRWLVLGERMGENIRLESFAREAIKWTMTSWGNAEAIVVNGDAAGNQRKDTGRSSIEVLEAIYESMGYRILVSTKANTEANLRSGIDAIAMRCRYRHDQTPGLLLNRPKCPILNDALIGGWRLSTQHFYLDGHPKPHKDGHFDHLGDTMTIFAMCNLDVLGKEEGLDRSYGEVESPYKSREELYGEDG